MNGKRIGVVGALVLSALIMGTQSGHAEEPAQGQQHELVAPGELTWQAGPPSLPAGAQFAVLEGDPKAPGLFTIRVKIPANYKIPAHWHPADEHVTVISGTLNMGMGDVLDTATSKPLPVGGFALMPAKMHHFAWASEESIVQLHGEGPWDIVYLNPADDPRKQ